LKDTLWQIRQLDLQFFEVIWSLRFLLLNSSFALCLSQFNFLCFFFSFSIQYFLFSLLLPIENEKKKGKILNLEDEKETEKAEFGRRKENEKPSRGEISRAS
jgi:hypothetical protein